MLARTEPACLVIADIAGYSSYLAGVELDHAQDILADLIDTVVGALRPSFGCPPTRSTDPVSRTSSRDQIRPGVEQDGAILIELAAADAAARAADRATEPAVPANTARHLSQPLTAAGRPIDYLPDDEGAARR